MPGSLDSLRFLGMTRFIDFRTETGTAGVNSRGNPFLYILRRFLQVRGRMLRVDVGIDPYEATQISSTLYEFRLPNLFRPR